MLQISGSPLTFATGTLNTPITVQKGETPIIRAYDANSGDGLEIDFDISSNYTNDFTRKINDYVFLAQNSLSNVGFFRFTVINNLAQQTALKIDVARENDPLFLNWGVANQGGDAQAYNLNDLVLPLNESGTTITTNTINLYSATGDPLVPSFILSGSFNTTQPNSVSPLTYQIVNGETARFKVGELRIKSK